MKNLLGRLHARSNDQRERIAMLWRVPVFDRDTSRSIGRIYQAMTDPRAARDTWLRLDPIQQRIVRLLVPENTAPLTIAELAAALNEDEETTRDGAVQLFFWGILGRDGDTQELPIGEQPRVFVPGELMYLFRRVIEEIEAGDLSEYPLRRLLELRDDVELETTATRWGMRVLPGVKRRSDLIAEILEAVATPGRLDVVVRGLSRSAAALWRAIDAAEEPGPYPYAEIVERAGLTVVEAPLILAIEQSTLLRDALESLESALLVNHTWLGEGTRALFVPKEVLHPQTVPVNVPLSTVQPLPAGTVPDIVSKHPFALAWDVMTVVREISAKGPPVWVPGKELPTHWLRMINSRLWFHGESEPPDGYAATLLHLALGVGALEPAPRTPGMERAAIKPMPGRNVRWWRGLSFAEQTERLRQHWLSEENWIEGRESAEIDVRSADWVRFRHRLLTAVARLDQDEWVLVEDASMRLAEQDLTILGDFFEVAGGRAEVRNRKSAIALVISVELMTAFSWFGFVETVELDDLGTAMRVTPAAALAAREIGAVVKPDEPDSGPILTLNHEGVIHLRRPAPLHIWSLTAFADNEQLQPEAIYQMRPQSLGAALGAGFDLQQITTYLERQSGSPMPDPLETRLREWTAGYKRVKLRRAVSLDLDVQHGRDDLLAVLKDAGIELVETTASTIMVMLPDTGDDAAAAEQQLTSVLRKAGYVGMWMKAQDLA